MRHSLMTGTQIHVSHAYEYADATARAAATGFVAADVGKLALQLDNHTLWLLTDHSPITWIFVSLDIESLTEELAPTTGDMFVISRAGALYKVDADNLPGGGGGGGGVTQSHFPIPLLFADSNTNFNTVGTVASLDYYIASTGAQNANLVWNMNLPAGTYTWHLLLLTDSAAGIFHLLLDGSDLATIDGYAGGNTIVRSSVAGITVPGASPTAVEIKMATKNGSSSAYYGFILQAWLVRTGA